MKLKDVCSRHWVSSILELELSIFKKGIELELRNLELRNVELELKFPIKN